MSDLSTDGEKRDAKDAARMLITAKREGKPDERNLALFLGVSDQRAASQHRPPRIAETAECKAASIAANTVVQHINDRS